MADIKCPDCGKEQEDTNKFCRNCGANLEKAKAEQEKLDLNDSINNEEINQSKVENKKICNKCGYELGTEKFCPRCGQSTASIVPYESKDKTCPSCGNKITNEKFCPNCGHKIEETEPQQTHNVPQKYCRNCGSPIDPKAEICPKCGVRQIAIVTEKNPLLSLILSFIFPGIGQLYNNQNQKGICLIIAAIVSLALTIILIGSLLYLIVWLYSMYDAYKSAELLNKGEHLEDKLF